MRVLYHQNSNSGGLTIQLFPETVKEANDLIYYLRNADASARKVSKMWADTPSQKYTQETLGLYVNLNTKLEKNRTNSV